MKKLLGIVLSLALLTSCGSSSAQHSTMSYDTAGTADFAAGKAELSAGESANYAVPQTTAAAVPDPSTSIIKPDGSAQTVTEITNKKIVKNANLEIETKNVSESYDKLLNFIVSQGGYEFSKSLSNSSGYANLNAVIKIPPDKLDSTLEFAKECGDIINEGTSSSDITAQYTDTEIRLENMKKNLEKYYDYYSKATTIEEIVAIQTQIDNITANIESYEGQIKLWDSQIDESTLTIYIQEASDPNKIPKDIEWNSISLSTMGKIIQNGFTSVINGIVSFFQWLVIIIVSISPILIIAAIAVFIILKYRKNKKKKVIIPPVTQSTENITK